MSEREETWYPIHVYSGREMKIEKLIRKMMESNQLISEVCHDVKVPIKIVNESKAGKSVTKKIKILPGYVLLDLDLPRFEDNEEKHKAIVYAIRRIDGVTGFVNATTARGSRPVPITRQEMNRIKEEIGEIKVERLYHEAYEFKKGDEIRIVSGSFDGFSAVVEEDIPQRGKLKVSIEVFGRATSVEIERSSAEKK